MTALARKARTVAAGKPELTGETAAFGTDVVAGLRSVPKRLAPKHFYDRVGSELFERITQLPEYYPTRTEIGILNEHAKDTAAFIPENAALIEFGSGSSTKTRILLQEVKSLAAYVPVDISAEFLNHQAETLRKEFPAIAMLPVAADFSRPFELPEAVHGLPRVGFFPGSTIGNFEPHEAAAFLRHAACVLGRGATFIIGVDLVKDAQVLKRAYNDDQGVTAAFNLNLLERMNRELDAKIDVRSFEHHAFYNRERSRIEMHLASLKRQRVKICGECFDFRAGETIHTENSYKYTVDMFGALARGVSWSPVAVWTDPDTLFSVHVLTMRDEPQQERRRPDLAAVG